MYSRNRMGTARAASDVYGGRIPPGYGGSAFSRAGKGGVTAQNERIRPLLPPETAEDAGITPDGPGKSPEAALGSMAETEPEKEPQRQGLGALLAGMERDELLLLAVILLLCTEGEGAADVLWALVLLLIVR